MRPIADEPHFPDSWRPGSYVLIILEKGYTLWRVPDDGQFVDGYFPELPKMIDQLRRQQCARMDQEFAEMDDED